MTPVVLDFLVKTGIPAGLGVVIVMYLIRVIIPGMQQTFREEMSDARKTFRDTIKSEQDLHASLMKQVSDTIKDEGAQTRSAIRALDGSTRELTQVVFKMYGASQQQNSTGPN